MTSSKTLYRNLRIVGAAAMRLGGWAAISTAAVWAGAGYALTGVLAVMIAISVGLLAVGFGCRAALFVADVRYAAAVRAWQSTQQELRLAVPTREWLRVRSLSDARDWQRGGRQPGPAGGSPALSTQEES